VSKRAVTGDRSVWHNEELHDLHCPPNILVAKSTRMRWAGYVAANGRQKRCVRGFGRGYLRRRDHREDLGVDERKI
jgi:hypothetical protein